MKIKNKSQTNLFAKITYTETKGNVFLFKTYNKPLNEKKKMEYLTHKFKLVLHL